MKTSIYRIGSLAALAVAALGMLVACGKGDGSGGNVRIVDADASSTTNFDVTVGGATAATNLGYGEAGAYVAVGSASANVVFEPHGATTSVLTASFALYSQPYTVLAIEGSSALSYLVVAQSGSGVASGSTRLEFVQAAAAAGTLDFFVTAPGAALPASPSIAAISFPGDGASITPTTLNVASGQYQIRAIVDGDVNRAVIYDSGPLTLAGGADLLLAVVPQTGSASTISLLSVDANSVTNQILDQRVLVKAANFAPGSVAMDFFVDPSGAANSAATVISNDLAFGAAGTAYTTYYPATYRISAAATGQYAPEQVGAALELAASSSHSVYAVGLPGSAGNSPYVFQMLELTDDLAAPASGMAKVRIVDLSPDLEQTVAAPNQGKVDVVFVSGGAIVPPRLTTGLTYLAVTPYLSVLPGSYSVAVVPTSQTTPLLPSSSGSSVTFNAGSIYTLVVSGCQTPASGTCSLAPNALAITTVLDQ